LKINNYYTIHQKTKKPPSSSDIAFITANHTQNASQIEMYLLRIKRNIAQHIIITVHQLLINNNTYLRCTTYYMYYTLPHRYSNGRM